MKVPGETTVAATRSALDASGAGVAFVTSYGNTVGVVTRDELDVPAVEDSEPVSDVVVDEIVHVPPAADYLERMDLYRQAAWDSVCRRSPERRIGR